MSKPSMMSEPSIRTQDSQTRIVSLEPIEPGWDTWRTIAASTGADIDRCWTCGSCDNGCPVSLSTGRLSPMRNVRMAVYGMLDRLLALPDIWYCLSCRRCLQGCPNRVRPYELHRYLRNEALQRGIYAYDFLKRYRKLFAKYQRVRWRAVAHSFKGRLEQLPH